MRILIKGARIVGAGESFQGDCLIDGEIIAAVGTDLSNFRDSVDKVINAEGKWLLPGAIDVHVHLEMPFMGTVSQDDYESGTKCAVAGGTTSLIDFCLPAQDQSLSDALAVWDAKAADLLVLEHNGPGSG